MTPDPISADLKAVLRRLKLSDLRLLHAVVQWGGMARAAERLNISQPAVSKAVKALEHTLGVRLLDRNPQGVEPTVYGQALLKGGVAVFDELEQSVKQIAFLADPTAGIVGGRVELRVGDPARPTAVELYELVWGFPQEAYVTNERYSVTANLFTRRSVVEQQPAAG